VSAGGSPSAAPGSVGWVVLPAFLVGVACGAALIVRDCALTCNVGYRLVPLAYLAIAGLALPVVGLQLSSRPRVSWLGWQARCALLGAAVLVVFRAWTWRVVLDNPYALPGKDPAAAIQTAYLAYYVAIDPVLVLMVGNLVGLVRRVSGERARDRLPVMAASILGGGAAGSAVAGLSIPALMEAGVRYELARDHLLLLAAACLVGYAGLARVVAGRFPHDSTPGADASASGAEQPAAGLGIAAALGWVREDRRLWRTGVLLACTGLCCVSLDYLFYWLVADGVDASQGRTVWFAGFYLAVNGASLVLLLAGTGRLLRWPGLTFGLLALPVVLLVGSGVLLVALSLYAVVGVRLARDGVLRTLYEPATEHLMLDAPPERCALIRALLGGTGFSLGMGLAALCMLGLSFGLGVGQPAFVVYLLATAALWAGAVVWQARARAAVELPAA
jgi:hypothetical protein